MVEDRHAKSARLAAIVGHGAHHPLGVTALSFAMASRADLLLVRETRFVDARGDAIGVCHSDALPEDLHGFERLVELAAPALAEAARDPRDGARATGPWPLVIALPRSDRSDDDERYGARFAAEVAARSGVAIASTATVRGEQAAAVGALEAALALLAEADEVIVGAVDSYYDPRVLAWLDANHRLHAPGADDGFIPAEGAAFLRLRAPRCGGPSIASVLAAASGHDDAAAAGEPSIATAMTRLVGTMMGDTDPGWVLTDENGEVHRTEEWSMVRLRQARLAAALADPLARRLGDTGTATGFLAAVLAGAWWSAGCAPATRALVALHSETGGRGGFVIEGVPVD